MYGSVAGAAGDRHTDNLGKVEVPADVIAAVLLQEIPHAFGQSAGKTNIDKSRSFIFIYF